MDQLLDRLSPQQLRAAVVTLLIIGGVTFLCIPAAVTASPHIADALGFSETHEATVIAQRDVDAETGFGLGSGRFRTTVCEGASYRVQWQGGDGVVRHCWDEVKETAAADAWISDPVTGEMARDAFDGWMQQGDKITVVAGPRGQLEPDWRMTNDRLMGDLLYVLVLAGVVTVAGYSAWRLAQVAGMTRRALPSERE